MAARHELSTKQGRMMFWDWGDDGSRRYQMEDYSTQAPEDKVLAQKDIEHFIEINDTRPLFGMARTALDMCVGPSPRESAIIAPLIHPDGEIVMGDIGKGQLEVLGDTLTQLELGRLGIWHAHQAYMTEADRRWQDAFQTVGRIGQPTLLDIFTDLEDKKDQFDIGTMGHGVCSFDEYKGNVADATHAFVRSVRPEGLIRFQYMGKSTGYYVNGKYQPAGNVGKDEMSNNVERDADILYHETEPASGQARREDDPTTYDFIGSIIAKRKGSRPTYL